MRLAWVALAACLACGPAAGARAQPLLDPPPMLDAEARAAYADWLLASTPRVFAAGANGKMGWYAGGKSIEAARSRALQLCAEHGGADCRPYAENLEVVWPGRAWRPAPPPGPLVDTINYGFVPDERFLWHGPAAARGVVVWSHGLAGRDIDSRGLQPPPLVRAFNDAGFDVIRFDRAPMVDNPVRAAGWLREELAVLRRSGYRMVVAGGQSRGAWTSLQMLDTPGLVDGVIALSPAAHGSGGSSNLTAQDDDLRALIADAAPGRARVMVAQFAADPFMSDGDTRAALLARLRGRAEGVLLIDRPAGFSGHYGGLGHAFAKRFGACVLDFVVQPRPPAACEP